VFGEKGLNAYHKLTNVTSPQLSIGRGGRANSSELNSMSIKVVQAVGTWDGCEVSARVDTVDADIHVDIVSSDALNEDSHVFPSVGG